MKPLVMKPSYKDYIWGGARIVSRYLKKDAPNRLAESWEVSDRCEGMSFVAEGPWRGYSLRELSAHWGRKFWEAGNESAVFPLLVKLIDAADHLSVQVHPSESSGLKDPKTEAWYVLEEGPMYVGFKTHCSPQLLEEAVREGAVEELLYSFWAKQGELVYIPSGTIHAIGKGCLVLEVQQNSNTTYRVYDWGRPRELHWKEACSCLNFQPTGDPRKTALCFEEEGIRRIELIKSPYFCIERLEVKSCPVFLEGDSERFQILFDLQQGSTVFMPSDSEPLELNRESSYLKIYVS